MKQIKPNDPETRSADLVQENLDRLKALFPDAFVEGKVDFEVLKQLLGGTLETRDEKYGLNWHGKRMARQLSLVPSTGTLRPCPEESIDWDTTHNLIIEGDNLEVLKLLSKSFYSQVDVIYIDPPYNTGGDFVYPDSFQDSLGNYLRLTGQLDSDGTRLTSNTDASGRFHTTWLQLLLPRLRLARNLLAESGVLLVSIDDHEVSRLRLLCDELFGEENFVACMIWEKGRKNDAKLISVGHEYIVVYAKNLPHLRATSTVWREEKPGAREIWEYYLSLRAQHGADDKRIEDALQSWFTSLPANHPSKRWARYRRVDSHGPWRDRDISWPGGGGPRYDVLHPVTQQPCRVPEDGWRFSTSEEMQRQIRLGLVAFREDHSSPPFRKAHIRPPPAELLDDTPSDDDSDVAIDDLATQVRGSYFYKQSQVAVKALRELMGARVFPNPKDHTELARLFSYCTSGRRDALVLDFFAGSGSTGHAVLDLNKADAGHRRYILVQLPEPLSLDNKDQRDSARFCATNSLPLNIAALTRERMRRAGESLRASCPSHDLGFRALRLDTSCIRPWAPRRDNIAPLLEHVDHVLPDRSESDILFEVLLKFGLDPCTTVSFRTISARQVACIGAGTVFACFSKQMDRATAETIALGIVSWWRELTPATHPTVVCRDSAFADDVAKSNMVAVLQQSGISNIRSL